MNKIKCVITKNGTIIPLHSIASVSTKGCTPHIMTICDRYYELSDEQCDALLREIEFID